MEVRVVSFGREPYRNVWSEKKDVPEMFIYPLLERNGSDQSISNTLLLLSL